MMGFQIIIERAVDSVNTNVMQIAVKAGTETKTIGWVYEKEETGEIRFNLADDIAELAEAVYTYLPLIDLATV